MTLILAQMLPSDLFEMAFTAALAVGGVLLIGALVSFAVFGYRSITGDGMRDPREVVPEKANDEDDGGLTEGGSDDEWDYY